MSLARLVGLCERSISAAGFGSILQAGFSERFSKLLVTEPFPAVVHLGGAVFPLTNQGFGLGRTVMSMLGLQLEESSIMPHDPIVADPPFGLQAEDLP